MKCPKCEEGTLSKIRFKASGKIAYLCDSCNSFWYEEESISKKTGYVLEAYSVQQDMKDLFEYTTQKDAEEEQIKDKDEMQEYE